MAFNIEQFRQKLIDATQSADLGKIVLDILKIPEVSNVIYNDDRVHEEFAPKFRDILAITSAPTPSPHFTGNFTTTLSATNRQVPHNDDTSPSAAGKRSPSGDEGDFDNPRPLKCICIDDGTGSKCSSREVSAVAITSTPVTQNTNGDEEESECFLREVSSAFTPLTEYESDTGRDKEDPAVRVRSPPLIQALTQDPSQETQTQQAQQTQPQQTEPQQAKPQQTEPQQTEPQQTQPQQTQPQQTQPQHAEPQQTQPEDGAPQNSPSSLLDLKERLAKKARGTLATKHLSKAWRICDAARNLIPPATKIKPTDSNLEQLRKLADTYYNKKSWADSQRTFAAVGAAFFGMQMVREYDAQKATLMSKVGAGNSNDSIKDLNDEFIDRIFVEALGDEELCLIGQDQATKRRVREKKRSSLYYHLDVGRQSRRVVERFGCGAFVYPNLSTDDLRNNLRGDSLDKFLDYLSDCQPGLKEELSNLSYVLPKMFLFGAPPYQMEIEKILKRDLKHNDNISFNDLFTLPQGVDSEMCKLENEEFIKTGLVTSWPGPTADGADGFDDPNVFDLSASYLDLSPPTSAGESYQPQPQLNVHNMESHNATVAPLDLHDLEAGSTTPSSLLNDQFIMSNESAS